jgi:hypothetical protein
MASFFVWMISQQEWLAQYISDANVLYFSSSSSIPGQNIPIDVSTIK